jgi:hypothetical protein
MEVQSEAVKEERMHNMFVHVQIFTICLSSQTGGALV